MYILVPFLFLFGIFSFFNISINYTKSAPLGFYKENKNLKFEKGIYVKFCPLDNKFFDMAKERGYISSGFCHNKYSFLLKKISALKGDKITINEEGGYVNNILLPHSKPLSKDGQGRSVPKKYYNNYILKKDEVLLMSPFSSLSFDARYFGVLSKSVIDKKVFPLFVW